MQNKGAWLPLHGCWRNSSISCNNPFSTGQQESSSYCTSDQNSSFFFYCTWDKSRIATMASKVRYYLASAWVPRLMLPMHQPQLSFCFWNTPSPLSLRSFNLPGHLRSRHGLVDNFSFPIFSPQVISSMRPSFGTPSILLSCAFL